MNILIVDDDRLIHEMIMAALAPDHHEIKNAFDIIEGMSIFSQTPDIDLVITDIVMPGEDGTKLIKQIKTLKPSIPVLAITGGVENALNDYVDLASLYSDFTIAKPFTKSDLQAGIATAIQNARINAKDSTPDEAIFDTLIDMIDKYEASS